MLHNRGLASTYIFDDEAGYAQRDAEPGGAVNLGISFLAFSQWRAKKYHDAHQNAHPTFEDLKNLTVEEATEIYGKEYFDPIGFDDLPSGLDYVMANTAVMQGVTGAKKLYATAQIFAGKDPLAISLAILLIQACAKMHSKNIVKFANGWSDRFIRVATRAAGMIGK